MKQEIYIVVLDKHGKPLMPTTRCGHVRKLLKSGEAVAICNNPFTIRLKYETENQKQKLYLGFDTGRENIGNAITDEKANCSFLGELETKNKSIKLKMQDRKNYRKERRRHKRISKQRKAIKNGTIIQKGQDDVLRTKKQCKSKEISYPGMEKSVTHKVIQGSEAQFNNRKRPKGWLTPSGNQLIQMHLNQLKELRKLFPITHVVLERVSFDFQLLENENIKAWEYGKGPLYGFKNYKDYINNFQNGKCLICGCDHIDEYHHIKPRKDGGTDTVKNIAGLCDDCHKKVHKNQEYQDMLLDLRSDIYKNYSVSLLNSVMPKLIEVFQDYCDKEGLTLIITDGYETAKTRKALNLPKEHCIDAYCISLVERDLPNEENLSFPKEIYQQRRFKKKSGNNINARNQREYYYQGKLVAKNRHKAMDQKEDSLEEYMAKYTETHSKKECDKHFHELTIKPAKRTYTYHKYGTISPIHVGDTVKYEKKNKIKENIKKEIFVATNLSISESKIIGNNFKKKLKYCKTIKAGNIPFINKKQIAINSK